MSVTETGVEPAVYTSPIGLHGAAVEVYLSYAGLDIQGRRIVEDMLLQHAFLPYGSASYCKWKKSNEHIVRAFYLHLLDKTSASMAEAWSNWALETSLRELPVTFWRGMMLDVLSNLVRLRFKEQPLPGAGIYTIGKSSPVMYYPPVNVRGAGLDVYRIYAGLMTPERRVLEDVLLGHAFLSDGPNAYGDLGKWNLIYRRSPYIRLKLMISLQMANAWRDWASETSINSLGPDSCRAVVRSMLSDLVRLKWLECPLPDTNSGKMVRSKQRKVGGNRR